MLVCLFACVVSTFTFSFLRILRRSERFQMVSEQLELVASAIICWPNKSISVGNREKASAQKGLPRMDGNESNIRILIEIGLAAIPA